MKNSIMIENLDMEKLRQASPEERREFTKFEKRMTNMFEQEMNRLRKKTIPGSNGIYLIGISKEPWKEMRFIIGSEEYYDQIKKDEDGEDYIIGGRI